MLILDILNNLNLLISILNHVDILNRHSRIRTIGDRQNSGDSGQRSSYSPKKRGPLDSVTVSSNCRSWSDTFSTTWYNIQEELLGIQAIQWYIYIIINPDWEFMGIHFLTGLFWGLHRYLGFNTNMFFK